MARGCRRAPSSPPFPGPYYTWIGLNTQHEKLKDIRVRKAIQRAIDVKSLLDAAYGGVASVSHGVVTEGVTGHRTTSKYSYNPDEARALLKEAGVSDLSLEFKTLNEAYRVTAAQVVQANLADVGIKVDIIPLDSGPFWNLGLESKGDEWKTLQMWWMRYRMSPDPSDGIQWFLKNQVGVWNWERWSDPEFEELWVKGLGETDTAKRNEIYLRMQEIMEDTGAYVWITNDPLNYAQKEADRARLRYRRRGARRNHQKGVRVKSRLEKSSLLPLARCCFTPSSAPAWRF